MATDINIVVLVGRLTRESDLKYTNSGTAVCKFSLAVNRKMKVGDRWEEEVSFIDVVLWGKSAEALHPYLDKGKQVSIAGELRQSRWEQDGQNRSKLEVVANTVELLGGGKDEAPRERPQQNYSRPNTTPQRNVKPQPKQEPADLDNFYDDGPEGFEGDDIPF